MNLYKSIVEKHANNDIDYCFKVLVVEDDDVGYMLLHEILESYPIKLSRAYNGEEAINFFQHNKSAFDLILMDIRLPKVNGYDATQKIKGINPKVPIVAVTAYAHSQGIIDCYNSGCDDFIAKPYEISKIERVIENYLILKN